MSTAPRSISHSLTSLLEPTQFSFASRHHALSATYTHTFTTTFVKPSGLHPIIQLAFPKNPIAPSPETCTLHAFLLLPSFLFVDQYQLADSLLLASKGLRKLRALYGEKDLEAPDWAVHKWGSAVLIELAPPAKDNTTTGSWRAEVPLHLRYLAPAPGGSATRKLPKPVVFWACHAEHGTKMKVNPFDRINLGYDGLFGPQTMFYHFEPAPNPNFGIVEPIAVPVLDEHRKAWLDSGTGVVVVLGFLWILWRMVALRNWQGDGGSFARLRPKKEQ